MKAQQLLAAMAGTELFASPIYAGFPFLFRQVNRPQMGNYVYRKTLE